MPFTYEYPRPALTVDVLIVSAYPIPRILLIQRKLPPSAGLWALPGGFVNENEPLLMAAKRELFEETGLQMESLTQFGAFGDAGRDPRGWTVSVVYLGRLAIPVSILKAGDDAQAVGWFALDQLPPLAFDHADIVEKARPRLSA